MRSLSQSRDSHLGIVAGVGWGQRPEGIPTDSGGRSSYTLER